MNKITQGIAILSLLIIAAQTQAASITNGNFGTTGNCSLSGWSQNVDPYATFDDSFSTTSSASGCTADVSVGDWGTSDSYANSLSQKLDLSGANDSTFLLSIDFSVDSQVTSADSIFDPNSPDFFDAFWGEGLIIGLQKDSNSEDFFDENGNVGSLFEMDIDGFFSDSLEFILDSSFADQSNWSLNFQLDDDFDGFGSTLSISNVSLTEVLAPATDVPEPTSLAIFALGFAGLMSRRKIANELVRKSFNK